MIGSYRETVSLLNETVFCAYYLSDELHILNSTLLSKEGEKYFEKVEVIKYDNLQQQYTIDHYL